MGVNTCHTVCGQRTSFRGWFSPAMEVLEMNSGHRLGHKHLYLLNHFAGPQAPKIVFEFHLNEIARVAL